MSVDMDLRLNMHSWSSGECSVLACSPWFLYLCTKGSSVWGIVANLMKLVLYMDGLKIPDSSFKELLKSEELKLN